MSASRILTEVTDWRDLAPALQALLEQQRQTWPAMRDGEAALAASPMRRLAEGDASLMAQANLRRSRSTFARTDAESVAARPCFLCEANLPPEERGVGFGPLIALPNPFPALGDHLTLATREHVAQRLEGRVALMHTLTRALGDDHFLLYNGPRCGASAPDHFHFQSGRSGLMGVFAHSRVAKTEGLSVLDAGGRSACVVRHVDAEAASELVELCLARLGQCQPDEDEPMVNVLSTYRAGHYVTLLFPRLRHRPGDFFTSKSALAISPAALEMGGLVVVCNEAQFQSLTAEDVEGLFREVCVPVARLQGAMR